MSSNNPSGIMAKLLYSKYLNQTEKKYVKLAQSERFVTAHGALSKVRSPFLVFSLLRLRLRLVTLISKKLSMKDHDQNF